MVPAFGRWIFPQTRFFPITGFVGAEEINLNLKFNEIEIRRDKFTLKKDNNS